MRTLLNLLRLLLGPEHRWCEDPVESAPLFLFFLIVNRIFEGLNMLEKFMKLCTRVRTGENLRLI